MPTTRVCLRGETYLPTQPRPTTIGSCFLSPSPLRELPTSTPPTNKRRAVCCLVLRPHQDVVLMGAAAGTAGAATAASVVATGAAAAVVAEAAAAAALLLALLEAPPVLLSSLTSICLDPSSVPFSSWIAVWASSCIGDVGVVEFGGVEEGEAGDGNGGERKRDKTAGSPDETPEGRTYGESEEGGRDMRRGACAGKGLFGQR